MPFPFILSTTSHLSFQQNFTSSTHPSLPASATTQRNLLRSILKTYKRLSPAEQSSNLNEVLSVLTSYLKYVCTLDLALSGSIVNDEDVDLALISEVEVEWRPTLASGTVPGREADRTRGRGFDYEFFFAHQTYAIVHSLLARQALLGLYAVSLPTQEQRLMLIQTATRHLKTASNVHAFLLRRATLGDGPPELPPNAVDVVPSVQSALQRLAQAEYNLLTVFKDDPYPAILVQARNESDREWMIKAPEIPKTRAQVLTRLCVGAADHAAAASAILKSEKRALKEVAEYADDLKRTAKARACRFQAIAADAQGETGKGIAWIFAGLNELGLEISQKDGNNKTGSLSKLKASWNERKEDRRILKGSARWGADAGKAEEARILEYLEKKLVKSNDTVHFQRVTDFRPLAGMLPSGMNIQVGDEKYVPLLLQEDELIHMRALPDTEDMEEDSSGDEVLGSAIREPAGTFPGTSDEYKVSYY